MATRKQAKDALASVVKDAKEKFPGQPARLAQLEAHAATVAMCIDHLYDSTDETEQGA